MWLRRGGGTSKILLLRYFVFFCSSSPPVLLISLDGFWSGYLKRNFTPFLNSLGKYNIINIAYFLVYYLLLCSCQWCEVRVHEERISHKDVPKPLQHSHSECVGGGGGEGGGGEGVHVDRYYIIPFTSKRFK